jgi:hypothetical protein
MATQAEEFLSPLDLCSCENEELRDKVAVLRELLSEAGNRGLIYWEPQTRHGAVSKAGLMARISAALAASE